MSPCGFASVVLLLAPTVVVPVAAGRRMGAAALGGRATLSAARSRLPNADEVAAIEKRLRHERYAEAIPHLSEAIALKESMDMCIWETSHAWPAMDAKYAALAEAVRRVEDDEDREEANAIAAQANSCRAVDIVPGLDSAVGHLRLLQATHKDVAGDSFYDQWLRLLEAPCEAPATLEQKLWEVRYAKVRLRLVMAAAALDEMDHRLSTSGSAVKRPAKEFTELSKALTGLESMYDHKSRFGIQKLSLVDFRSLSDILYFSLGQVRGTRAGTGSPLKDDQNLETWLSLLEARHSRCLDAWEEKAEDLPTTGFTKWISELGMNGVLKRDDMGKHLGTVSRVLQTMELQLGSRAPPRSPACDEFVKAVLKLIRPNDERKAQRKYQFLDVRGLFDRLASELGRVHQLRSAPTNSLMLDKHLETGLRVVRERGQKVLDAWRSPGTPTRALSPDASAVVSPSSQADGAPALDAKVAATAAATSSSPWTSEVSSDEETKEFPW